jgi:hypothetical protein
MSELQWMGEEQVMTPEGVEQEVLLAAALAATLVAYHRQVRQSNAAEGMQGISPWQTLGRWEQLRGRA